MEHDFEFPNIDARKARLIGIAFVGLLALVLLSRTIGMKTIAPSEVAVIVNNLTGKLSPRAQAGAIVYCPYFQDIHVMDKTIQTMEMTSAEGRGDRLGRDDVRVKTRDGSDVSVDITLNYQIESTRAIEVMQTSGPGDLYKAKWMRDYARSICRHTFGELTTEEFYEAEKRTLKAMEAKEQLNEKLRDFGIVVLSVIPQDFHFYKEYEEKIKEKKLADQEIEEQVSQQRAADERRKLDEMRQTKEKEVEIARFVGEMKQQKVAAQAEADKVKREAEAYAIQTKAEADAEFIRLVNDAKAVLATKKAEAEGIQKLTEAFQGPGGVNLVRMEYAKRLKSLKISGQPVSTHGEMQKLEVQGAASGQAPSKRAKP